jgi:hypothetical protein
VIIVAVRWYLEPLIVNFGHSCSVYALSTWAEVVIGGAAVPPMLRGSIAVVTPNVILRWSRRWWPTSRLTPTVPRMSLPKIT